MKKLALTIAALSLSAGAAFAENPYVGNGLVVQSGPHAGAPVAFVDRTATASIVGSGSLVVDERDAGYQNPAAGRFGDAAPRY